MRNLDELEAELPKFPVYKSFILPYRYGRNEIVDVLEADINVIRDWREMLSYLREFLKDGLAYSRSSGLDEVERVELINDLIILFLRIPLIRELLPTIVPSPLKLYLFNRLNESVVFDQSEDILDYVYAFYDKITRERFSQTTVSRFFDNLELCELVERCWFRIPADTRPGLNSCGLIPHMLLSSALAWALAIDKELPRNDVAIVTLTALLHDIGKPIRYRDHVTASKKIAEELLRDLLSQETVDKVARLIELHHLDEASDKVDIVRKADQIASRIDRLSHLLRELLKDELDKLSEETGIDIYQGYEGKGESWDIWEKLYKVKPDAIKELSRLFVKKIRESLNSFQLILRVTRVKNIDGVLMGLVDIGSIQEFIMTSSELRSVMASSLVVDTITVSFIPLEVQRSTLPRSRIPLGNIVYAAGGVIEFIIPEKLHQSVQKALENLNKKTSRIGLPVRVAYTTLKDYYSETILELNKEMQLSKLKVDNLKQHILQRRSREVRELCQICYLRAPEIEIPSPEGMKKVCSVCEKLYKIGSEIHFRSKYELEITIDKHAVTPEILFGRRWDSVSKYILEIVAGHDGVELDKLERNIVEYRNLAVIKFDGNLMGPFMASSISLADACERSARIDLALKKAIDTAIKHVYEAVGEVGGETQALRAISQIKFGLMYVGGDDALIFIPSWLSIGFTLDVGEEFLLNMGKTRGLSIGLAVSKSKADIWGLIDAATKLLEESKKSIGRREPSCSCICFDISEVSTLTGTSVERHLIDLRYEGLTVQPLRFDGELPNFKQLISLTISKFVEPKEVFKNCYYLSRFEENGVKKISKRLRRAIAESLSCARNMAEKVRDLENYLIPLAIVYAYRQAGREDLDREARESFEIVTKLYPFNDKDGRRISMFSDADRLIKISGGGAL